MTSPAPAGSSSLPLARVKTIMKSSPDVESVSQESLFLVTKATVSYIKLGFYLLLLYNFIL